MVVTQRCVLGGQNKAATHIPTRQCSHTSAGIWHRLGFALSRASLVHSRSSWHFFFDGARSRGGVSDLVLIRMAREEEMQHVKKHAVSEKVS